MTFLLSLGVFGSERVNQSGAQLTGSRRSIISSDQVTFPVGSGFPGSRGNQRDSNANQVVMLLRHKTTEVKMARFSRHQTINNHLQKCMGFIVDWL